MSWITIRNVVEEISSVAFTFKILRIRKGKHRMLTQEGVRLKYNIFFVFSEFRRSKLAYKISRN